MKKPAILASILVLVLLSLVVLFLSRSGYLALLSDEAYIEEWVRGWGIWAPVGLILLHIAQVILAPFPGHVLGLASGYLFGPFWGLVYSMIGSIIGSLINMSLARRYGRPLVLRFASEQMLTRLEEGTKRRGLPFFFFVFLVPALPDDIACWAAGLTSLPISALMLVMIAGRTPGMLVSTLVGANAAELTLEQWAGIGFFAALLAAIVIWKHDQLEGYALRLANWMSARIGRRPQG